MKAADVIFPKPIKVLQAFSNTYVYTKLERSYEDRKKNAIADINSKSGYIAHGELYLPEAFFDHAHLECCDLIVMKDHHFDRIKNVFHESEQVASDTCSYSLDEMQHIDIFQVKQDKELELYLAEDNFPWRKGVVYELPRRASFKIGELKQKVPVEVKINYKGFNALVGTERFLEETSYVYEYLGDFTRCHVLRESYDAVTKKIPRDRKVVDLLKELWM